SLPRDHSRTKRRHIMKPQSRQSFWLYAFGLSLICMMLTEGLGLAQGIPPGAGPPILFARLSGAPIDGVSPSGKAEFGRSMGQNSLIIGASGVNLPDSSVLAVNLNGKVIGSMVVLFGNAGLLPLSSTPEVHPGEVMTITLAVVGGGIQPLAPAVGSVIMT